MMKRILAALCAAALLALTGCAPAPAASSPAGKEKLTVYATLFPQYDFAREIAGDRAEVILLLPPGVESHSFEPTPADIAGISKSDLLGKKKNKEFVEPRQICIYLITDLMSLPLMTIGQKMGGRDHTTVIYARDKVAELINTNPRVATQVDDLKNMLLKK